MACIFFMIGILYTSLAWNREQAYVDKMPLKFLRPYSSQPMRRIAVGRLLGLLLLTASIGSAFAQGNVCTKNCLDKNEGPCSGLSGKEYATCLGQCMKSCKSTLPLLRLLKQWMWSIRGIWWT